MRRTATSMKLSRSGKSRYNCWMLALASLIFAVAAAAELRAGAALSPAMAPPSITTTSPLPYGIVNSSYSQTLAATGGTAPYTWTITVNSLPANLSLSTTGVISGTPTAATPSASFTVQVKDSVNQTNTKIFSIAIYQPLAISTPSPLPSGTVNSVYTQPSLAATGGTGTYTWSLGSGTSLPPGLSLSNSGAITGTPTTIGTSTFTVNVVDSASPPQSKLASFSLTINPVPLSISTTALLAGTAGSPYAPASLTATGGTGPYTWSLQSGSLPAGMNLSSTGVISGTPSSTSAGLSPYKFTVKVTDSGSRTATADLSLTINPATLFITTTSPLPAVTAGSVVNLQLMATGGTLPYTWSLQSGALPNGLTLTNTGVIGGTTNAIGSSTFTVRLADGGTQTASATFTLAVNAAPLSITTTPPLPDGVVGLAVTQNLAATGGTGSYTWSLQFGSLPAGLTLSSGGVITGTPTASGSSSFTVRVADSGTQSASATLTLAIYPVLSVTTTSPLTSGAVGLPLTLTLGATGGTGSYTWSLQSGTLPAGLNLLNSGAITGTPTAVGTSNFTVKVVDTASPSQNKSASFSLTINPPPLSITITPLPNGSAGSVYPQTSLTATGGTGSYTWSVQSGSLPTGLTLSSAGVISGTPTAAGAYKFTVKVADSGSQTATADLSVTINAALSITTASPLATGTVNVSYSQALTATGGTAPYTWSIAGGQLAAGLTLSPAGQFLGTPTAAGTFVITVQVADTGSPAHTATKTFLIKIADVLTVDSTALPSGLVGKSYQQTLSANGGSSPYSWSLVGGNLPAGVTLTSSGVLIGNPSVAGTFSIIVQVSDSAAPPQIARQTFVVVFTNPLSIVNPTNLNNGSVGSSYLVTMVATGGTPAYSWSSVSGQLPPGITLSSAGIISGTPTTTGTFNFTIQVTDSVSASFSQAFVITVQTGLTITTNSLLPNALANSAYSQQLQASSTGTLTWSVISGSLPSGITLSSGGLLSGTPSILGLFNFTVQVTSGGGDQVSAQAFKLQVLSALGITSAATLPNGTVSSLYTATLAATGGVGPYTWTLTNGTLPDGLTLTSAGLISGTPGRIGVFTFTVQAADSSTLTASGVFTISVVAPTTGSLSLVNIPDTANPAQQIPIGLSLSAPQPNVLSGSLTMTFTSNSAVPSDDPAVQFSTGSRQVSFTIPPDGTAAVFPTSVWLLTGTVSGTIVVTADIQDGAKGVTVATITIAPTVPQLTNTVAVRTADGLKVRVTGYSPERKITKADFAFDVKTANGTQRVNLSRTVESDFDTWYTSAASSAFGSSFVFEQLFVVQGDSSAIQSVTVTLTNGQGSTSSTQVAVGAGP